MEKSGNGDKRSRRRRPVKNVKALLRRMRIHPEARRILGTSCVAVVSLERLNFHSLLSLQRPQRQSHGEETSNWPEQNRFSGGETETFEVSDGSPEVTWSRADAEPVRWTEEPAEDSGFDCDSNPDRTVILFDSGSEGGNSDPETFYLDPDAEPAVLIELNTRVEVGQDRGLQLEDEPEVKHEANGGEGGEEGDRGTEQSCNSEQRQQQRGTGVEAEEEEKQEEHENEDFCAVCLNGGELLCCDRCPKVYHLPCHVPALLSSPTGDWVCSLCRSDQDSGGASDRESVHSAVVQVPYALSDQNQRRCEKLCLLLCCHDLSAPFHEPVSSLARNYYQIIKRPIDLSIIRRKLDRSRTLHYFTPEQFVEDVLLMFRNCATFNYPDSEVAQAGRKLEAFFLTKLKEIFPDRTFPAAAQLRPDRAHLHYLGKGRREHMRRKRRHSSGRKYCL